MPRKIHKNTGLIDRKLNPCPNMPNCVVSMYPDQKKHFIKPFHYKGEGIDIKNRLKATLSKKSGVEVLEDQQNYLHFCYTIPLFGFKDDVEFLFDEASKRIHFRSASRIGYSDLGVNRFRMKRIRQTLKEIDA